MPPKNWHHQGHGNNMHQQNYEGSSSNQQIQNGHVPQQYPQQYHNGQRYTDMRREHPQHNQPHFDGGRGSHGHMNSHQNQSYASLGNNRTGVGERRQHHNNNHQQHSQHSSYGPAAMVNNQSIHNSNSFPPPNQQQQQRHSQVNSTISTNHFTTQEFPANSMRQSTSQTSLNSGVGNSLQNSTAAAILSHTTTHPLRPALRTAESKAASGSPTNKKVCFGVNSEVQISPNRKNDATTSRLNHANEEGETFRGRHAAVASVGTPHQQQQQQLARKPTPAEQQQQSQKKKKISNNQSMCRIPGHNHIWKLCPDNPNSKNYRHRPENANVSSQQAPQQPAQPYVLGSGRAPPAAAAAKRKPSQPSSILKQPPVVLPSTKSKSSSSSGASSMFNTSNSARPIPRKTQSESSMGGTASAATARAIPKKRKFQRAGSKDSQIQAQQDNQKEQIEVTYKGGHFKRARVPRAPSGATASVVPLGGDRTGRIAGAKSKRGERGGANMELSSPESTMRGSPRDAESRSSNSLSSPEKSINGSARSPPPFATGGQRQQQNDNGSHGLLDIDSDSDDDQPITKRPAKNKTKINTKKTSLGLDDSSSSDSDSDDDQPIMKRPAKKNTKTNAKKSMLGSASSSESSSSDNSSDDDSSDDNLPMAEAQRKRSNKKTQITNTGQPQPEDTNVPEDAQASKSVEDDAHSADESSAGTDPVQDLREELMELDDDVASEFEKDFFHFIEQTIHIKEKWNKKKGEGLSIGRKKTPEKSPEGDKEDSGKDTEHDDAEMNHDDAVLPMDNEGDTTIQNQINGSSIAETHTTNQSEPTGVTDSETSNATARQADKQKNKKRKASNASGDSSRNVRRHQEEADDWTQEERQLYREGASRHPGNWGEIASNYVKTKSVLEIREYARRLAAQESLNNPQENPQDSVNQHVSRELLDDDTENRDTASVNSDDDETIPAFLTCNICEQVFGDKKEAWTHEDNCKSRQIRQGGIVYNDKNTLIQYMIDRNRRDGTVPTEEDLIYYKPGSSVVGLIDHQHQASERRDSTQSPSAEAEEEDDASDQGDDGGEPVDMNLVKHLCYTTVNPMTGLPTQRITTICTDSETLYDFRVDIKQSGIPNAGYGAYLTYLGARVLNDSVKERGSALMKAHTVDENYGTTTHATLQAKTLGGRTMTVKLTGDNLHYNDNSLYWTSKRWENYHIKKLDENEADCAVHDEVERLRNQIPERKRIGFLGIHQESDYRPDDNKQFWCFPNEIFELGRYGPHRPEDRKIKLHYDFKNFIQNFEPSEWSYDDPSPTSRQQMIDITDDKTGEVHELAKKHTPIYVNEVGHNNKLHRNVFIQETQQSVNYYVGIDREHAMNKGDTVELLVDYGDHYEDTRERKGYGQVNTSGYMGGDDDEASRLSRNLYEREEVEKDISTMKVYEMYHLIEFLTTNIFNRLEKVPANMRPRDLIARRRLFWIGEKLEGRYQGFLANDKRVRDSASALKEIRVWLDQWRSVASLPSIYPKIDESLRTSVHDELTEELLYQTLSLLPNPLNESIWCKVAVNLTKDATVLIGQYLYCYPGTLDALKKESLSKKLLMLAKNSALAIRDGVNAIKNNETGVNAHIKDLSFNTPKRIIKKKNLANSSKKERIFDLYDNQDTIRYGTAASMADIQAYYDAVELCGVESYYIPGKNKRVYDCERSIISQYEPRDNEATDTRSPQHHWMARSVDAIKRGDATVNEQWYIENQVLLVLHILASTCVDWSSGTSEDGGEEGATETWYSLEKLCAEINLDLDKAKRALSLGVIDPNWPKIDIKPSYVPSSEGNSSEPRRRRGRRPAKRKVNPSNKPRVLQNTFDEQYPEWTIRAIQRASSHHVDNYYSHPDLPQGLIVRSRTGVKTLIDYAEANNCGIAEAYEEYKGVKKYFSTRRG